MSAELAMASRVGVVDGSEEGDCLSGKGIGYLGWCANRVKVCDLVFAKMVGVLSTSGDSYEGFGSIPFVRFIPLDM